MDFLDQIAKWRYVHQIVGIMEHVLPIDFIMFVNVIVMMNLHGMDIHVSIQLPKKKIALQEFHVILIVEPKIDVCVLSTTESSRTQDPSLSCESATH